MRLSKDMLEYYSNNIFYRYTTSFHYPIWDDTTATYREASNNTNKVVADALELSQGDVVLDAGCGVGGTAVWMASHYDVRVTGITIVPSHIKRARDWARKNKTFNPVKFELADYADTGFKGSSFDKVFGIESVCHAPVKSEFLREAYRLLKPGGKLVVLDAFRVTKDLSARDEKVYRDFLEGFVLDNLVFRSDFCGDMKKIGFGEVSFESQVEGIQKTLRKFYIEGSLAYPIVGLLQKVGLIKDSLGHIVAARNSKYLIDNNILDYGLMVGVKR